MTLPYNRKFNKGRQSEQFLNEESHRIFTALKNINYKKEEQEGVEPQSVLDGALWFDKSCNQLKYYDMASRSWKCVFSQLFQITNNITSLTTPSDPVLGQLWIYNGVLTYFDGSQWQPIRALEQSSTQWSNAAFEDFQIVSPLNSDYLFSRTDDTEYNTNYREKTAKDWSSETGLEYKDPYPTYTAPDETVVNRYLVPNVHNDRFFLDNKLDTSYTEVNDISIECPQNITAEKILTAVHMNPGKLKGIRKRLFKIDKANPSIKISAYNTEFYGFRLDKFGGEFLVQSKSQDIGDYVISGDTIILNREAAQNYDYVVAITYDFLWSKANGSMYKHSNDSPESSFYIVNRKSDNIAVHVDGVMLEEAVYDLDKSTNTVTINEDVEDLDIDIWSPINKQFGYIRETQLDGTGIIRLHTPVSEPLVFVGGLLIDPEEIKEANTQEDTQVIYVPKELTEIDDLHNLPWCVVDLYDIDGETKESSGAPGISSSDLDVTAISNISEDGNLELTGTLETTKEYTDVSGKRIYNYLIDSGSILSSDTSLYIRYDKEKIDANSRFLLFINGLAVCTDAIIKEENYKDGDFYIGIRDDINGILTLNPEEISIGDRYTLIVDNKGYIYSHLDLEPAFNIGLISDGLVYADGKLLFENREFSTYDSEDREQMKNPENGETLFFISNEETADNGEIVQSGYWASYDSFNYRWIRESEENSSALNYMRTGYTRFARMLKVDEEIESKLYPDGSNTEIDIRIYAFRFANSVSGTYSIGTGEYYGDKTIDEYTYPVIKLGTKYSYGSDTLNLYLNGVKLISSYDYEEMEDTSKVILRVKDFNSDKDIIQYIIEPIEYGETQAYSQIILNRDNTNSTSPNVYKIAKNDTNKYTSFYPGRLTAYINGIRLSNNEWMLVDNETIMLRFSNYLARGSSSNFPLTAHMNESGKVYTVANDYSDYMTIEIRKDYDRKEQSFIYSPKSDDKNKNVVIIDIEEKEIPLEILDSIDEILIFINGQFSGLSKLNNDYYLDKKQNAIVIKNIDFVSLLNQQISNVKNKITLVWR